MPFDYEEYERKCRTLPIEALQKEWENYTRQIAGGATSASLSVLFAPVTAGVSTVGLGLSAPRIHNARKKREIIEAQLQAYGTTHHTRKRDVFAPMAISGGLGGLTLGLAGPGADIIAGAAVGHGVEYVVSHVALETVGATLEHGHVTHKKTKEELKLVQKYSASYQSNEKLEDAMSYGFDPQKYPSQAEPQYESIPVPPPYSASPLNQQPPPQYQAQSMLFQQQSSTESSPQAQTEPQDIKLNEYIATAQNYEEKATTKAPALESRPVATISQPENDPVVEKRAEPQKLPFVGLPHETEAEERGLHWDATRGMYVRVEHLNTPPASGYEFSQPPKDHPDEVQHLMSQLLVEGGVADPRHGPQISIGEQGDGQEVIQESDSTPTDQSEYLRQYFPPPPPLPATSNQGSSLLSPSGNVQGQVPLLLQGQSGNLPVLPPRPHSSLENFENLPSIPPPRPRSSLHNHPDRLPFPLPPPPPRPQPQGCQTQTSQGQYYAPVPLRPQQVSLAQYSPQTYSPQQYTPSLSQNSYQPFPPPPPAAPQYQPNHYHPQRPGPQPVQHAYIQHRDSVSSISTISSASSIFSSASTVSAATTPLTSYSTNTKSFYNPSQSRTDSIAGLGVCTSPSQQYPPPPPINGQMASMVGKQRDYSSQGSPQAQSQVQFQGWNKVPAAQTVTSVNEPDHGPPPALPNIY